MLFFLYIFFHLFYLLLLVGDETLLKFHVYSKINTCTVFAAKKDTIQNSDYNEVFFVFTFFCFLHTALVFIAMWLGILSAFDCVCWNFIDNDMFFFVNLFGCVVDLDMDIFILYTMSYTFYSTHWDPSLPVYLFVLPCSLALPRNILWIMWFEYNDNKKQVKRHILIYGVKP